MDKYKELEDRFTTEQINLAKNLAQEILSLNEREFIPLLEKKEAWYVHSTPATFQKIRIFSGTYLKITKSYLPLPKDSLFNLTKAILDIWVLSVIGTEEIKQNGSNLPDDINDIFSRAEILEKGLINCSNQKNDIDRKTWYLYFFILTQMILIEFEQLWLDSFYTRTEREEQSNLEKSYQNIIEAGAKLIEACSALNIGERYLSNSLSNTVITSLNSNIQNLLKESNGKMTNEEWRSQNAKEMQKKQDNKRGKIQRSIVIDILKSRTSWPSINYIAKHAKQEYLDKCRENEVVVSTYNAESYIRETIRKYLKQNPQDCKFVASKNNNSND